MVESVFAGLTLAVCVVLLVRLTLGRRRQLRFDAAAKRAWTGSRLAAWRVWHWRSSRRTAATVANDAIRRARGAAQRDGNVIRPRSFRGPRRPH